MGVVAGLPYVKGHGTENDFLLLPDPQAALDLTPVLVRALCDRHAGLGADGVLRVVRTALLADVAGQADDAEWFMDYRNADGSTAEMCGNGVRVFARYLAAAGWVSPAQPIPIATRGGVRVARFEPDGDITVDMGRAELPDGPDGLRVSVDGGRSWPAVRVYLPNPHAVAFVDRLDEVGDLLRTPDVTPGGAFPDGVNVEFVVGAGPRHITMRVHERGVGETRSCGTGVCAAAVAAMRRDGAGPSAYEVDVPGGRLLVTLRADGQVELTGPAVLVAEGEIDAAWLSAHVPAPAPTPARTPLTPARAPARQL